MWAENCVDLVWLVYVCTYIHTHTYAGLSDSISGTDALKDNQHMHKPTYIHTCIHTYIHTYTGLSDSISGTHPLKDN